MLTAAEAANRVAQRVRRHAAGSETDNAPLYPCENCGGHDFCVSYSFTEEGTATKMLPCRCPDGPEMAAVREVLIRRKRTRLGPLGDDHRVNFDEEGDAETEQEETDSVVECRKCLGRARAEDWHFEPPAEFKKMEEEAYWEVRYSDCHHEIEFGWSHPDRGGRIWPCESSDFNPWKSIPETRFVEAWGRRGWLRPVD